VLVELGLVEQRWRAVLEVLNDGATVTDVACRYEVSLPRPVGSRLRMTSYKHFMAACSLGTCPRARVALRKRACRPSIAFVE